MIDYLYDMDYSYGTTTKPPQTASWDPTMAMHCKVYVLAIKYEILGLKEVALAKLERRLQYSCAGQDYADALQIMYKFAPETEKVMEVAMISRLLNVDIHLLRSEAMRTAVRDIPTLAYDLLWAVAKAPISLEDACPQYHSDGLVVLSCKVCERRILMCEHLRAKRGRHPGCTGRS